MEVTSKGAPFTPRWTPPASRPSYPHHHPLLPSLAFERPMCRYADRSIRVLLLRASLPGRLPAQPPTGQAHDNGGRDGQIQSQLVRERKGLPQVRAPGGLRLRPVRAASLSPARVGCKQVTDCCVLRFLALYGVLLSTLLGFCRRLLFVASTGRVPISAALLRDFSGCSKLDGKTSMDGEK